ncbi:MAG: serine/threonine-protein kinase [Myxococcota bacterium]|nr:serine/threonine-protein kinase [Myxococcota bacterium]
MSSNGDDWGEGSRTMAGGPAARGADTMVDDLETETIEGDLPSEAPSPDVDASPRQLSDLGWERYEARRELGEGGMGKVDLCHDHQIGREVAVKVLLPEVRGRTSRERFIREARVQAQLEHPGVVPVYDLGVTPSGQPYFAMKRVKGITLQRILVGLASKTKSLEDRFHRRALLSIVERVIETVAYAHSRGVVHRDLKPANIMVGDYGEVNVLDWGIAKLRTDTDLTDPTTDEGAPQYTVPGSVVGTAGYMSPEQATGDEVDARADVYTLGVILFECCTHQPLHKGSAGDRMRSTVNGVDARPSARLDDPEFPTEIDVICERATAPTPDERYADAGEMLEALRAYLEGERNAELRREVAGQHAEAARVSMASDRIGSSETVRVQALRELGAAAVLDPGNREMIGMIEKLLTETEMRRVPDEVEQEIEVERRRGASLAYGRSALAYTAGTAVLPILWWMGIRDWPTFFALTALLVGSALGALVLWRHQRAVGALVAPAVPFAFATLAVFSAVVGPFFLVPALASATAVAFTVSQRADWKMRGLINACSVLSVMIPLALQQVGVLPRSIDFQGGMILIMPHLVDFPALPTSVLLFFVALFVALVPNILVGRAIEALNHAERKRLIQNHRLRQMLPG